MQHGYHNDIILAVKLLQIPPKVNERVWGGKWWFVVTLGVGIEDGEALGGGQDVGTWLGLLIGRAPGQQARKAYGSFRK